MTINMTVLLVAGGLLLGQTESVAETDKQAKDDALKKQAEQRQVFLRSKAVAYSLQSTEDGARFRLTERPVLKYSNPTHARGTSDGATFLWVDGDGRPLAACSFSIRRPDNRAYREFATLSAVPLQCRKDDELVWSTNQDARLVTEAVTDAPAPARRETLRLTQMRFIARRFTASRIRSKPPTNIDLRVLPQPLYRFAVPEKGIVDGGLFAFVVSNDPELLLILTATAGPGESRPRWRYGLAQMSSQEEQVKLDERVVWSAPNYYTVGRPTVNAYLEGREDTYDGP